MAEARLAVAPVPALGLHHLKIDTSDHRLQAAVSHDGVVLYVPAPQHILRNARRGLWHVVNRSRHSLWPARPSYTLLATGCFAAFVLSQPSSAWVRSGAIADWLWTLDSKIFGRLGFGRLTRVAYLAILAAFSPLWVFVFLHRTLLSCLLGSTAWIFEPADRKKMSFKTKCWWFWIKILTKMGARPLLYTFQSVLPTLPVPDLEDTIPKYLETMRPLLDDENYASLKGRADQFLRKEGRTLQRYVKLRSWLVKNYVSDWWLAFVYLRQRTPIFINSNFYGIGCISYTPTHNQVARAARLISELAKTAILIDQERLPPLQFEGIPFDMDQYKYAFSTTRVPGMAQDRLVSFPRPQSRHVAVLFRGVWYRVPIFSRDRRTLLTPAQIQKVLLGIVQTPVPRKESSDAESAVSVLTTMDRARWAAVREHHFSGGVNKASLDTIERAMFVVHLDEREPQTVTELGNTLMTGLDGTNRWCDKSFNLIVFKHGLFGVNAEHSWGDAPIISHVLELAMLGEFTKQDKHDKDGFIVEEGSSGDMTNLAPAERVHWHMNPELEQEIEEAKKKAKVAIENMHLVVSCFDKFGKEFPKAHRLSPDAFVQLALQIAYWRDQGTFSQTYEAAMTRFFLNGRTETVRSCSVYSRDFVLAFDDPKQPREKVIELLRKASEQHQLYAKQATAGQGVDRHLFALYVVAKGKGVESQFLVDALSVPWRLSTSQVPQRQMEPRVWKDADPTGDRYFSASGGFGPVADDGYGVCYAFSGSTRFFFNVSSARSCDKTDSDRMVCRIFQAISDLASLLDDAPREKVAEKAPDFTPPALLNPVGTLPPMPEVFKAKPKPKAGAAAASSSA